MDVSANAAGPGELLRAAREQRGLEQREAADLLNLPCRFVTAMEDNAFDRLPAATFARGYLRAYARLLSVDADEVLSRYAKVAPPEPVEVVHRPPRRPLIDPSWLLIAAAVVVLGLTGALGWMLFGGDEGETDSADRADRMVPPPALDGTRAEDQGRTPIGSQPAAVEVNTAGVATATEAIEPAAPVQAAPMQAAPMQAATEPGARVSNVRNAGTERRGDLITVDTGFGDDVLEISYREDCWTEIHDLDGAVIFQDLMRGDRRLRVTGAAPFRILLGYAGGATVTLNGQVVALAPHTRDGVANLVVGQ